MIYVTMSEGRAIGVATECPQVWDGSTENRNDWKTGERAAEIAAQLTEATGKRYIATDAGGNVWPRHDVIAAPVIGAEVSKGFNGDFYPEGVIVKVSASLKRVETSTGAVFFRRGSSGCWIEGGTWAMVAGSVSERNPHF